MHRVSQVRVATALLSLTALLAGCHSDEFVEVDGGDDPVIGRGDPLPGVVVTVLDVRGGSGAGGTARVGDHLEVEFTVAQDDDTVLRPADFVRGRIVVSGPTFSYQRVIAEQTDVLDRAVVSADGRWTYRFAMPIPASYLPPLNDTDSITDGELTGQPLLGGTYTVALSLRRDLTVDDGAGGAVLSDVGTATVDFLFGSALVLEPRRVVASANCLRCHGSLEAHRGWRDDVGSCLLCHTAGAEDANDPDVGGGTPGVTVDFRVMIHKIHAGGSLPSVLGVGTAPTGLRDYAVPPQPYRLTTSRGTVSDFSDVHFPMWPSASQPMPRDVGYSTVLTPDEQALENAMRSGPVACAACHGDPDGAGPIAAPAQGDLAYAQPTRAACGSCHDDWDPELPYESSGQPMPPQPDDSRCKICHLPAGNSLAVVDGHRHPLVDSAHALGVNVEITALADVGPAPDGILDTGERLQVTFTVRDDGGDDVPPGALSRLEATLRGPAENPNLVHLIRVPTAGIGAGPTFTIELPESVALEYVGDSDGALNSWTTARGGHWNVAGGETRVFVQTGTGAATTSPAAIPAGQNFLDVAATGGILAGDHVVLGAGPGREFLRVRLVDGSRLWLSSLASPTFGSGAAARPLPPAVRTAWPANTAVTQVTLAEVPQADWTLNAGTGQIVEGNEFGTGAVVVSYTASWIAPARYPVALNGSPDLGASWGDWAGLPLLAGVYDLGLVAARQFPVDRLGEVTTYTEASPPAIASLRALTDGSLDGTDRIDGAAACNACHGDLQFHGGNRRGVLGCLQCHGLAGGEDAPRYVFPSAAATPGVTVDFRTMLHKIHQGRNLSDAAGYEVVGFGGTSHRYDTVGFPHQPGGTADCATCHGPDNTAWQLPADRVHPDAPVPTRVWRAACNSCHDSAAATAHIDSNTSPSGAEACAVCHGTGDALSVPTVHQPR